MTTLDVFITYSSTDRPWAQKLATSLTQSGFKVFFDRDSLRAGEPWELQLQCALEDARHLVVLWSESARHTDWVTRERATFEAVSRMRKPACGKLLVVRLDQTPSAFASMQEITELVPAYAAGVEAVSGNVWNAACHKLKLAISDDPGVIPVPLALLTLTRAEFEQLTPQEVAHLSQRFGAAPPALAERYGSTRLDWRPFAGGCVSALATEIEDAVNAELKKCLGAGAQRIRWDILGDALWADAQSTRAEVERLNAAQLSVLLIDAVALTRHSVYQKLQMFQDCLSNPHCVILVVPPFAADRRYMELRRYLTETASPYFDRYFFPEIPPRQLLTPHCALGHADVDEMKRALLVSFGHSLTQPRPPAPRTFLGM